MVAGRRSSTGPRGRRGWPKPRTRRRPDGGRASDGVACAPATTAPPLGAVIGFALSLNGTQRVSLWITGDTVLHRSVRHFASSHQVDVLLMHLGLVRFPLTGRLRYSMDSTAALELLDLLRPRVAVPVHYEGWSHFSEPEAQARAQLTAARTTGVVRWLEPGVPRSL